MLMNKNILVFGALSILAAAAPLAAQTDPTRPPVSANRKAEEELKGIDLDSAGAPKDAKPGLPSLPIPSRDDKHLSGDLVSSAKSANELVGRHAPTSGGAQYMLAAAIGCGALGVLLLGWVLSKRRR